MFALLYNFIGIVSVGAVSLLFVYLFCVLLRLQCSWCLVLLVFCVVGFRLLVFMVGFGVSDCWCDVSGLVWLCIWVLVLVGCLDIVVFGIIAWMFIWMLSCWLYDVVILLFGLRWGVFHDCAVVGWLYCDRLDLLDLLLVCWYLVNLLWLLRSLG